jgi:hypothetical protein
MLPTYLPTYAPHNYVDKLNSIQVTKCGHKAGAQAKAKPGPAKAKGLGPACDFIKQKPLEAGPKPRLSGQAKAGTSLAAESWYEKLRMVHNFSGIPV